MNQHLAAGLFHAAADLYLLQTEHQRPSALDLIHLPGPAHRLLDDVSKIIVVLRREGEKEMRGERSNTTVMKESVVVLVISLMDMVAAYFLLQSPPFRHANIYIRLELYLNLEL